MSRFFFHLDHGARSPDLHGTELDGLSAAKCHAVQFLAETLCNQPHVFWENETWEVTVTDETGLALFTVALVATMAPAIGNERGPVPS